MRAEGASNGGSKCSAECTLCQNTADHKKFEILRPSGYYVTTFCRILYVRTNVWDRATYGRSAIDIALFCSIVRLACQLSEGSLDSAVSGRSECPIGTTL